MFMAVLMLLNMNMLGIMLQIKDMRNENHLHLNEADLVRVFLDVLVSVVDVMLMVIVVMEHLGWHRGAIPPLLCPIGASQYVRQF